MVYRCHQPDHVYSGICEFYYMHPEIQFGYISRALSGIAPVAGQLPDSTLSDCLSPSSYKLLRGRDMVLRGMSVNREIALRTGRPAPSRDVAF
jgi:hypothetical protein